MMYKIYERKKKKGNMNTVGPQYNEHFGTTGAKQLLLQCGLCACTKFC